MKTILRLFVILGFILAIPGIRSFSQVGINSDGSSPDASSGLDVKFNNKGFLPPRMTLDQRNSIPNPAEGLMIYCTNGNVDGTGILSMYQGGKWYNFMWVCPTPVAPASGTHVPSETQIIWNWNTVPLALGYKWNTVNDYSTATDVGTSTSKTETGLIVCVTYTRYVWAYNTCGHSSACVLTQATLPGNPPAPTAGTPVPGICQIVWHWNAVPGATGYRGNISDDYSTSGDLDTATSVVQNGLTPDNPYSVYIWAYNTCGHSTSSTMLSSQTLPGTCLAIGTSYQGGIIFYIDGTGEHGLIASPTDQGYSLQWSYPATSVTTSTYIGTGQANTTAILIECGDQGYAAKACDDYVNDTYNDWFLPSKDELNEMYLQRSFISNLFTSPYWSSSQYNHDDAWTQDFSSGTQTHTSKTENGHVRAIRAF